jgi:RTA1 like protein
MFYGGTVFMTGWILRAISAHNPSNLGLFIAQTICIYAGPPIYAAAEYNTLGRLMHYLPMHAPLNPNRVLYFFIYLGALVESLTGAGAGKLASSKAGSDQYKTGGTLIAAATVLQAGVECVFISMVALLHYRCLKAGMLSRNVKIICVTLYGTSFLIIARCVFRAVEAFTEYTHSCGGLGVYCGSVARHEWYLYAFEAAPMVLYTWWLNVLHPGRFLPATKKRYLDVDGKTERMGPGWIDERAMWKTFVDPFSLQTRSRNDGKRTKFWLSPNRWRSSEDGSFALGTASNHGANRDIEKK